MMVFCADDLEEADVLVLESAPLVVLAESPNDPMGPLERHYRRSLEGDLQDPPARKKPLLQTSVLSPLYTWTFVLVL